MAGTRIALLLLFATGLAPSEDVHGQDVILGLQGGLPKHYEAYEKYFEDGRLWGGAVSTRIASNLELGLALLRSTWDVVDGNSLEELSFSRFYTPLPWESRGDGRITEIAVTLRLLSRPALHETVSFFAQLGFGYYWIDLNAVYRNPSMCFAPNYEQASCEARGVSYDRNNPGLDFGVGAAIPVLGGLSVDIQPTARVVFAEKERITYYSIDIALRYRLDLGPVDKP